jgi:hypothetical protein
VTADPMSPPPGGSTLLTIHIARTNGGAGGFYLFSNKVGQFSLAGGPVRLVGPFDVVHSDPGTQGDANDVLFQVRWTAPGNPGSVDFEVWAVSANGNDSNRGDGEGHTRYSLTYGCDGISAFPDHDGDGFGRDWESTRVCAIGPGFVLKGGDCDDNNKEIFPGHAEVCNFADDNCDGKINEGLPLVPVYADNDGDGHGARYTTDMLMRCGNVPGYAVVADDCNDMNKDIFPGAPELCDGLDNDCNGRIDENARASCGFGWCRRLAASCDPKAACTPGQPRAEMCNNFDDDCDGVIDNGADLCGGGLVCYAGYCLSREQAGDAAAAAGPEPRPEAVSRDGGLPPTASGGVDGGVEGSVRQRPGGCAVGGAAVPVPALILVIALVWRRRRVGCGPSGDG